jgi:DNA-binding Xre family transcriptional regulator
MQEAFSKLKSVLERQGCTTADLVRKISESGDRVNAKSIYRLADPEEALEKVDMRVISAVCEALGVGIGDILTFDPPTIIEQFGIEKQERMDSLMIRHNGGDKPLTETDLNELKALVEEAESVARGNARRLANRKRRLLRTSSPRKRVEDGHQP